MSIYNTDDNFNIKIYLTDFLVNGGGGAGTTAGIAAAEKEAEVLVINKQDGTSKLSCSDKMTVYSAINSGPEMLFDILTGSGCVHRELAQIVAYNAQETFYYLKLSGVPFLTHPETGAVLTYKTDNSPVEDGTSTGPRTARDIFNVMQKKESELNVKRIEGYAVTRYLTDFTSSGKTKVVGAIAVNAEAVSSDEFDFTVVFANATGQYTGGAGELFRTTLLPDGMTGDLTLSLDIGAKLAGMENFQFGLGSGIAENQPKYATSGDMLRTVPKILSIDQNGVEREFLREQLSDRQIVEYTFLKGSQYPSVAGRESSIIDHLIYLEMMKERKVYFDYTENPSEFDPEFLGNEGKKWYAERSSIDLTSETKPIERLKDVGRKAYLWYLNHEQNPVNLAKEKLQVSLTNQHVLGGIEIDSNTRVMGLDTNIEGLYAAGECALIFGPERPGGSSLMANYALGRVSGTKAAEYSLNQSKQSTESLIEKYEEQIKEEYERLYKYSSVNSDSHSSEELRVKIQEIMTQYGHRVRTKDGVEKGLEELFKIAEEVDKNGISANSLPVIHAVETKSLLDTAIATMLCIKTRIDATESESRGGHFVYPDQNSFDYNDESDSGTEIITTVRKDSNGEFIAETTVPRSEFRIPTWEEQARK